MGPKLLLLFIVGDILGAGVYAVTGQMAGIVGGIVWLPFLVAFIVATLTALSYLELVTKYPQAAGAALYTHKAFGIHFVTFLVAFAVICSGITSASTSSNVLAQNLIGGFVRQRLDRRAAGTGVITIIAMGFMVLLAADQPARRRREREVQRRPHPRRDDGARDRDRRRVLRDGPGRRRLQPDHHLRVARGEGHLPRRHRGDLDRVLRDGRLRGLGQHGRGDPRPGADLPAHDAHRPRHRGRSSTCWSPSRWSRC